MDVILKIPVRRYVFKYIKSVFGHPWLLNSKYKEGRMMQAFLERAPSRYEKYEKNEIILEVLISSRIRLIKGDHLSQISINEFSEIIKDIILDEIDSYSKGTASGIGFKNCDRVNVLVPKDKDDKSSRIRKIPKNEGIRFFSQKETIIHILEKYDITEDDLTYDSVVKHLQRSGRNKKTA